MTLDEAIAASVALDRLLASPLKDGTMPEDLGGKRLVGELGAMFDDVRKAVAEAKQGIAAAGAELMTEVQGLKTVETAIRSETDSVRAFKVKLLGNATGGENQG